MKVVTVYPYFINKGGAQDMAISVAKGIVKSEKPIVLIKDKRINDAYINSGVEFKKLSLRNIYQYHKKGYTFLSHHRKTTTFIKIISLVLFFNKLQIVHVAHNTFNSLKLFTLFPDKNIAVSNTVKENMIQYFDLKERSIDVIYNGISDRYDAGKSTDNVNDIIKILFLGRIDPVKRQVEFVKATKGKLADNVRVYFGGLGIDYELLKRTIQSDPHYIMLGLIDPYKELYKYDYVCLYSEKEGLPLSLIEAQMFCKPLLTNDIPQCLEINRNNYCGFVDHSWEDIIKRINNLPLPKSDKYHSLSANSRSIYETKFSYEIMIKRYIDVLSSINPQ